MATASPDASAPELATASRAHRVEGCEHGDRLRLDGEHEAHGVAGPPPRREHGEHEGHRGAGHHVARAGHRLALAGVGLDGSAACLQIAVVAVQRAASPSSSWSSSERRADRKHGTR